MKTYFKYILLASLICVNTFSMENGNTKKRKLDQIENLQQEQSSKDTEIFQLLKEGSNGFSIQTDDIIVLLKRRITTNKAFWILSNLPDELVIYFLNIFIKQKISFSINRIISNKNYKPYFSNQEDSRIAQQMQVFLDSLFNRINRDFRKLYVNLIILIGLIDRLKLTMNLNNEENNLSIKNKQFLKLQDVCHIIKKELEKPKFKRKIRKIFNNITLDKLNMFENPNLLKACQDLTIPEKRSAYLSPNPKEKSNFIKRWDFLLNYLLEYPKQIPHDLKIYCGHWLARSNRTKDLYNLISTHNCSTNDCCSDECKNTYILDKDFPNLAPFPQFKKGTLLMTALYFRAFDVARWLVRNNIQIDKEDSNGDTALLYCIEGLGNHMTTLQDIWNYHDIIRLLLNAGSDKNFKRAIDRLNRINRGMKLGIKYDQKSNRNLSIWEKSNDEISLAFNKIKADVLNWLHEALPSVAIPLLPNNQMS